MAETATWTNIYSVTRSGNSYSVPGTTPLDNGTVGITDVSTKTQDTSLVLGDIQNDTFQVSYNGAGGDLVTKTLTFDGVATANGLTGFVAHEGSTYYFVTNGAVSSSNTALSVSNNSSMPICFMAGTLVQTPEGERQVEDLKIGNLVMTADGDRAEVTWIGRQTVSTLFADPMRVLPVRIRAGALGENMPSRDLLVSPDHAILVDDVLIQAGALVNGSSIVREHDVPEVFTYFHVEVKAHALILAENTPAETFIDNIARTAFDNWAEHEALYPDPEPIEEMPYPRAKAARQVPYAIRKRLAQRARALFGAEDEAAA